MKNKFLIIGGDMRQILCGKEFSKRGYDIELYGFSGDYGMKTSEDILTSIKNADYILLPIPYTRDNIHINTPLWDKEISLKSLNDNITNNTTLFGGMINESFRSTCDSSKVYDYAKNEGFLIKNAKITVEGAYNIIFSETDFSVYNSNILIVGYGRIGKILATVGDTLSGNITVSARKNEDLAWILVNGFRPLKYSELENVINEFDIIINTVPYQIFNENLISKMNKNTFFLDLASPPGGIDFDIAKKEGIKTNWGLSLPGKIAPLTSGKIICETIVNLIEN